jgi:pyruvate dehydrogenase E1 component alpha subunit
LAAQINAAPGIVACIFGDGACGAGALHETLNIAALWKLPLLLVCDNNHHSPASSGLGLGCPYF